jgi:hypothetical protein
MENYKVKEYEDKESSKKSWMITKRLFLIFSKPLKVDKISSITGSEKLFYKRGVVLTFDSKAEAEGEAKFLNDGGKPIKVVCFKNGKSYLATRKLSLEMVIVLISGGFKRRKGEIK